MKTIIIDDEPQIREGLKILLKPYDYINIISEASNIYDGQREIEKHQPDLVFLDIKLKNSTGFVMLEQLKFKDFKLVFITAYNEYAIKAFKYNAFDYLLKPIDPDELQSTLNRLKDESFNFKNQEHIIANNEKLSKLVVKTTEQIYILDLVDIVRCESDQGYTMFYLKNGSKVLSSKTLKEYNNLLPEDHFIRVHQSHLVNVKFIKNYNRSGFVELINSDSIPVSVRKRQELNKRLSHL